MHLEQIAHDYFLAWHEADSIEEKERLLKEYQREVKYALLVPLGIHSGEAAAIHYFLLHPEVLFNTGSFVAAAILVYALRRML